MSATCKSLRALDAPRREKYKRLLSHFENRPVGGLDPHEYTQAGSRDERRKVMNLGRSIVDAVQARVGKNRPKATFVTERGNWGSQRQAKKLDAFCVGILDQSNFYGTQGLPLIVRDAAMCGDGIGKVVEESANDKGRIRVERVMPWTVLVDPLEGYAGRPRSIYQYHNINRSKLSALYPDAKNLDRTPCAETAAAARQIDEVTIFEAWHLPSFEGAEDGLHVVCVENETLSVRPWSVERFPFFRITWTEPTIGYWGAGLLEDVEGLDADINEMLYQVQQAIWHHSTPKILEPVEGQIEECAWDNDVRGVRVKYSNGAAPSFVTPSPVSPDILRHVEWERATAYNTSGVSEMSATSQKPAGLNSGAALREFNDIESERFIIRGYAIEAAVVMAARCIVDAARRLEEEGSEIAVRAVRRRRRSSFVEKINWADVRMDEDAFVLKVFPTSALPETPAYKMAAIQELFESGLISQEQMRSLLDFPDLEGANDLATAPYEIVLDQLDRILEEGEPELPEPFQKLDLAVNMARNAYLRARIDRVEEDRLEMLRDYITTGEEMLRAASAPPPDAAIAPMGAAPPGELTGPEPMAPEMAA